MNIKNKNGITIVALTVTIVVMLILSGISVKLILDNKGGISKAKEATQKLNEDTQNAKNQMDDYYSAYSGEQTSITVASVKGGDALSWVTTTKVKDDNNNTIVVPVGFKIASDSATNINSGIVIEDVESGNQFVWVPVANPSNLYYAQSKTLRIATNVITPYYSKFRVRSGDNSYLTQQAPGSTTGIKEPDLLSEYDVDSQYYNTRLGYSSSEQMAQEFVKEYKAIIDNINQYKGFYVGRYELTQEFGKHPPAEKAGTTITDQNWYDLYALSKDVMWRGSTVATTMILGCQFDEIITWFKNTQFSSNPSILDTNSSTIGNYTGSIIATGSNSSYKINNIYDIVGNCWEWTQEAYENKYRSMRGGTFGLDSTAYTTYPASDRNVAYPIATYPNVSTRAVLYIK